jgi:hypothetical protein
MAMLTKIDLVDFPWQEVADIAADLTTNSAQSPKLFHYPKGDKMLILAFSPNEDPNWPLRIEYWHYWSGYSGGSATLVTSSAIYATSETLQDRIRKTFE